VSESSGVVAATPSPTVLDVLRTTPAGPLLDKSVTDVLSNLNLPQLPQLPAITLPDLSGLQMPTLPSIDLTTLIQPVISLLTSFGSGAATIGTALISIFSSITKALTSAVSTSQQATAAVSGGFQGQAAEAAKVKSLQAEADAPKVAAQGEQLKVILGEAEAIVAQGYAQVTEVITQFIGEVIAGGVFLFTPPGVPFLLGLATEAGGKAAVIAANTRVALTGKTGEVIVAGFKVPVTGAPNVADLASLANQVTQAMQPLLNVGATAAQKVVEKGSEVVTAGSTALSGVTSAGKDVATALTTAVSTDKTTTTDKSKTTTTTDKPVDTTVKPVDTTVKAVDTTGGGGIPGGMPMGSSPGSPPSSTLSSGRLAAGEGIGSGSPARTTANSEQTTRTSSMPGGMGSGAGLANKAGEEEANGSAPRSSPARTEMKWLASSRASPCLWSVRSRLSTTYRISANALKMQGQ